MYSDKMESNLMDDKIKELQLKQLEHSTPDSNWDDQYESEMKKNMKELLNDELVEQRLKDFEIWSMITKTSKITFITPNELSIFESHLESMICSQIMSLPPCMVNDSIMQIVDQARMISKFNLRRSSGTDNPNKLNERTVQATQIRQSFTGGGFSQSSKPGLLKRMFGMR